MDISEITREAVRDAFRHLSRDRTPGHTPLVELEVVRSAVEDLGFRPTRQAREFEIGRLLTELVERELERLRSRAGVAEGTARIDPYAGVTADFGHGHRELEAWSAIYYLYLRPDLDLGPQALVEMLGDRHRRTVQRRLRRGVIAVADRLRQLELAALIDARRARLAGRLPAPAPDLVGAHPLIERVEDELAQPGGRPIVALGGPGGIGKTATAVGAALRAADRRTFEHIVWLSAANGALPETVDGAGVLAAIGRALEPEADPGPDRIRALLGRQPCLVVVDALDDPERATAAAEALAAVPRPSRVLLTGRPGWATCAGVRAVTVPTLDRPSAAQLLRQLARERGLADVAGATDNALAPVLSATAGHPLATKLAVGQLRATDARCVAADFLGGRGVAGALYRDMWAAAWDRAPRPVRDVVHAVIGRRGAGCLADPASIGRAADLDAETLTGALRAAVDTGLLEPVGDVGNRRYRTALFLRRFLRLAAFPDQEKLLS